MQPSKRNLRIYDNGGTTADRYTAVYMDCPETRGCFACLGMSATPFHPQGIGQHGTAQPGPHLGKRIRFEDLPADCQKAVMKDLA